VTETDRLPRWPWSRNRRCWQQ